MGCKDVKVEYIRVSRQGFNRNIMGCKVERMIFNPAKAIEI